MNVKLLFSIFFISALCLVACKKLPVLPNHDPRSKGKRLSRTWILRKSATYLPTTAVDNTRVVVTFDLKGTYLWVSYSNVLGVESATMRQGKWKFIEQQSKIVLQEELKESVPRLDTFSIISLNYKQLRLQHYRLPLAVLSSLDFSPDVSDE
jgi:hypothetical protein